MYSSPASIKSATKFKSPFKACSHKKDSMADFFSLLPLLKSDCMAARSIAGFCSCNCIASIYNKAPSTV